MEYFKLLTTIQADAFNAKWLKAYQLKNPDDTITQRYCDIVEIGGHFYVVSDEITKKAITDFVAIVDRLPLGWHEENYKYQVYFTPEQLIDMAISGQSFLPETEHVKHRDNGLYLYMNVISPEYQTLLEALGARVLSEIV